MLRRLFVILLAVGLLAGCVAAPGETTVETTPESIDGIAVESTVGSTVETTVETTPETTMGTIPETTGADSRQYVYTDGVFCYHIPQVELPGVNGGAMNETLYEVYDGFLRTEVLSVPKEERFWLGLTYEVGRKDDVVSVTVLRRGDWDLDAYDVHYFSATTGEPLTAEAVYAAFGMTPEEGKESLRAAMERCWGQTPAEADPSWLEQKEKTLADSNINAVKPLITEKGELQFVGEFYSLAGADSYMHRFDLQGEFIEMSCREHG